MRISMGGEADLSGGPVTGTVVIRSEGWKREKNGECKAAERGRGKVGHTDMDIESELDAGEVEANVRGRGSVETVSPLSLLLDRRSSTCHTSQPRQPPELLASTFPASPGLASARPGLSNARPGCHGPTPWLRLASLDGGELPIRASRWSMFMPVPCLPEKSPGWLRATCVCPAPQWQPCSHQSPASSSLSSSLYHCLLSPSNPLLEHEKKKTDALQTCRIPCAHSGYQLLRLGPGTFTHALDPPDGYLASPGLTAR